MSYKYITQYDSPNFTSAADAPRVWGRPYVVTAIAIHWWGDPSQNPTLQTTVNTLINPNRGASAHFVASGTNREVAQLIDLGNASWATNSANPYTISIECDPRCRDEDYDVVAELISQIRGIYGNIPLVPHRQFVATACPGNYDLGRLDQLANTKDGSGDWGIVTTKNGGPTVAIIENADNWRGRVKRTFQTIRGRDNSEDEFQNFVGKDTLTLIEQLEDNQEANDQIDFANLGRTAKSNNWQGQISTLTGQITEKDAKIALLQAEIDSKPTETVPVTPNPDTSTTSPSDTTAPQTSSQTFWEWIQEILSKFTRSK